MSTHLSPEGARKYLFQQLPKEVLSTVLGSRPTPGLTLLYEGLGRPSQPQVHFIPKELLGKCPDKRRVIGDNHSSQESQILLLLLFI